MRSTGRTVESWVQAWDGHDGAALRALYTDDGSYRDVPTGMVATGDAIAGFAEEFAGRLTEGLRWELRRSAGAGDVAVAEWHLRATNRGLVPSATADGRPFDVQGATVFTLQGDRIVASSDYYDQATILRAVEGRRA